MGITSKPLHGVSRVASVTDRDLGLPPLFRLVTLREAGDAFAHGMAIAGEAGAGTLIWVRRADLAEFAVVLEPDEALATSRSAFYVGMNALADALAAHAPPERPITFGWPDAIRVDGVLVGGGRLGWPDSPEEAVPDWLVFSGMIRTAMMRAGEAGLRPFLGSLDELGFEAIDAGELLASFARHLMAGFHASSEAGFGPVAARWLERSPFVRDARTRLDHNGDLLRIGATGVDERKSLREALGAPSWLDPATGMPWR
jgi:biotin-(acetyl-CoA carboxylase) ligase